VNETALVIGDYRQTLTVVRALAAHSMRVVAGHVAGKSSPTRHSRFIAQTWPHPPIGDDFTGAFRDALMRLRPDVVFPVGDLEIDWLARHGEELPPVVIAAADPEVTAECQNKTALMQRAADLDVPHAPFRLVSDPGELLEAAGSVGFPCFVKPHDPLLRLFGKKGIRVDDAPGLLSEFDTWPEGHRRLIVQRFDEGPRHNVYFAAREGTLIGAVEVTILRTDRRDGTGLAVDGEVVPGSPGLIDDTAAIVGDLKYTGVGCTQFLVAGDGSRSFLELNPRLGANYVVAHAAGLDLASIAVDLAMGREVEPPRLRTGIRYAWTLGDLEGLKAAIQSKEITAAGFLRWLGDMVRTAWHADVHVTWRLDDPVPSLVMASRSLLGPVLRRLAPRSLLQRLGSSG
jgi:predicted ATP-grasp superfamily ATP-dependent carboligase